MASHSLNDSKSKRELSDIPKKAPVRRSTKRPSPQSSETTMLTMQQQDIELAGNAIHEVANSFALPSEQTQIGIVLRILLRRYTTDEIIAVAQDMPFDEALAEKLRYTRGLAVVDFSTRIETLRLKSISEVEIRVDAIRNAVFDVGAPDMSDDDLLKHVNAHLFTAGQKPTSLKELKEAIK